MLTVYMRGRKGESIMASGDGVTELGDERILVHPEMTLREYLGTVGYESGGFSAWGLGCLSVALQIETHKRLIRGAVGNSLLHLSKEEICTALDSVLASTGLAGDVLIWYDRLLDWKEGQRTRLVPVTDVDADDASWRDVRLTDGREQPSFGPVVLGREPFQPPDTDESHEEH